MKNKKIVLTFLTLAFAFNLTSVQACSLTDLSSCSFSDLKTFVLSLFSNSKTSSCSNEYLPVCAKSGKTYNNICLLEEQKESLNYLGSCLDYPYNLSADECVKSKFEWSGYGCIKDKKGLTYNHELGFSLTLPENSKIEESYIELPKERNRTNLILNKLEIVSQDVCSDLSIYTKVKNTSELVVNGNNFQVVEGEDSREYGNLKVEVNYVNYMLKQEGSCTSFLFSSFFEKESSFQKYDKGIEFSKFEQIMRSFAFGKKIEREIPCENYGDLNQDGLINNEDLELLNFGIVENDLQKQGDLNKDNLVDLTDKNILENFIKGSLKTFPVCSLIEATNSGFSPKIIFNNNVILTQDEKKTEAKIRINFDLVAEKGSVFIPADLKKGIQVKILNEENLNVKDITWNTGAQIKEGGYLFLEKGKTTWFSLELVLNAKEKSVYSKVLIEKINYLNEEGVLKDIFTNIETARFYLNYNNNGNLICGDYGDINNDGFITEEDISYIVDNKELDEEQFLRADVTANGEVNFIDAIEIKRYLLEEKPFLVCSKAFTPNIYESALVSVQNNEDRSKHVYLTFYLDSSKGDAFIPAKVSFNQDDSFSGIYFELERDGSVLVKNLKVWSSAEPTGLGLLKIKKDVPTWVRVEFDIEAINDTALVNFKLNKVAYLDGDERRYVYLDGIKTGDIFLNFKEEKVASPCDKKGDLNQDGFVSYEDYDYLKNNLNLLITDSQKFVYADLNQDGTINDLDLKELENFLSKKTTTFLGCSLKACNPNLELVYTKDGFIYANECYLKEKEVKCYLNKDCGL